MSFNASVEVTEIVLKTVENVSKGLARKCIMECALRHNFNAEEELRILGLDNVTVISKKREKKPVLAKEKSNKKSNKKSKKSLIIEAESEEISDLFAELTSDEMLDLNEKETLKSGEENMSEEKKAQKAQKRGEKKASCPSCLSWLRSAGASESNIRQD